MSGWITRWWTAVSTLRSTERLPAVGTTGLCGRRFGRPRRNSFPLFALLAPNRALRWIENPRVDGSIPSLATTSKSMNCMRFRVSPVDYRGRFWPEIG